MDIFTKLSDFYTDEYTKQEIKEMLNEALIHKTAKFLTVTWDDTGVMDIFKIVKGELVFLDNTHFMKEAKLEKIED